MNYTKVEQTRWTRGLLLNFCIEKMRIILSLTVDELEFYDEIECDDLFEGDLKKRIMIFQLPYYET